MLKSTSEVNESGSPPASEISLRSLFDREETSLLRYAYSLTGRRAVAEEIVQEVFLQLHENWDQVEAPRAWLYRTARNAAFQYLRKSKRELLQGNDEVEPLPAQHDQSPEALAAHMEACTALRTLLAELTPTDQQLVRLKYFEGLKYREISERTGLSVSNVGYRLHHILKQLAVKLLPLGIDAES